MPIIAKDISSFISEISPRIYELLSELGYDIYAYYETESLLKMFYLLRDLGLKQEAEAFLQMFYDSERYWSERYYKQTGDVIMFDTRVMKWRSMITGRFVKDPYSYLWGTAHEED